MGIYCKELSKERLIELGIAKVDENGNVWSKNGVKLKSCGTLSGNKLYQCISRYDKKTKKYLTIGVHRIVWIWFNEIQPEGCVVDHIDNNPWNNKLSNLQLLSPEENLAKNRKPSVYKAYMPKKKIYTLELIEEKIDFYTKKQKELKALRDGINNAEIAKKLHYNRSYIAQWKNRKKQFLEEINNDNK